MHNDIDPTTRLVMQRAIELVADDRGITVAEAIEMPGHEIYMALHSVADTDLLSAVEDRLDTEARLKELDLLPRA